MTSRPLRASVRALVIAVVVAVAATSSALPASAAHGTDDPGLDQTLDELSIVRGERVLGSGHVDMGPKFEEDGTWRFLIHDDVARADADATSVWRYPEETVFHVADDARLAVPDDPAYAFLGAAAGDEVHVIPQTQADGVVWLGWNTQDPEVMDAIDRGVTLSLTGVQGPGQLNVYLQSGSFGEPQQLWDSRVDEAQPLWVDVNTHTHANWVFSEPGVYLLELTATADLIDGSTVTDTQRLRFAVGGETEPDDALTATWAGGVPGPAPSATPADVGAPEAAPAEPAAADVDTTGDPVEMFLLVLIGLVGTALAVGVIVAALRGSRAKRRALTDRVRTASGEGEQS